MFFLSLNFVLRETIDKTRQLLSNLEIHEKAITLAKSLCVRVVRKTATDSANFSAPGDAVISFSAQNNCSMALSTTIIRFSPTPPIEPDAQSNLDLPDRPKCLDQVQAQHSKSLDPLPAQLSQNPQTSHASSALSCTRSQSESNFSFPGGGSCDLGPTFSKHPSDSGVRQLVKVDSGYCSNLNIQQSSSSNAAAAHSCQQWGGAPSAPSAAYVAGLGMPPTYPSEGLHYIPIPGLKPQCASSIDLPHQGDVQSLLAGRSLFNSQLNQHYLGPEVPMHPGGYHVGAAGNSLFGVSSTGWPFLFFLFFLIFLQ